MLKRLFFSVESELSNWQLYFLSCQASNKLETSWNLNPLAILALDPDSLHSFRAQDIELFMNESWVEHSWTAKRCDLRSIPTVVYVFCVLKPLPGFLFPMKLKILRKNSQDGMIRENLFPKDDSKRTSRHLLSPIFEPPKISSKISCKKRFPSKTSAQTKRQ